MIEVPLILIGYAFVPFIAILLMVEADRPQETSGKAHSPKLKFCEPRRLSFH